jgi:hypothetical protein
MRHLQISLLLIVVIFATGCPNYRPKVDFKNPQAMVNKFNVRLKHQYHEYECYRFGAGWIDSQGAVCENLYAVNLDKAKAVRNELLEDALPYIDEAYVDFKNDILAGRDRANFVADAVELGASATIGSLKGTQRSIQLVGIFLTAFRGGRRSADVNFYKDQTTSVLISKMNGNRAKVRAIILTREKDDVSSYPMGAAVQSIVDYYNAGTLVEAFTQLQQDTAVKTQQAEDEKTNIELHGVPISIPTTQEALVNAQQVLTVLQDLQTGLGGTAAEQAAALTKLQNIVTALDKDKEVKPLLNLIDLKPTEPNGTTILQGLMKLKRKIPNDSPLQDKINLAIINNGK